MNWDQYFLNLTKAVSCKSADPSTKVGCVIVGPDNEVRMTGFNGMPKGCKPDSDRFERPKKYQFFEHAERNALYMAARRGISVDGCTAYISAHPCNECARGLIQAGIKRVVYPDVNPFEKRADWRENLESAFLLLRECGVKVDAISIGDSLEYYL